MMVARPRDEHLLSSSHDDLGRGGELPLRAARRSVWGLLLMGSA